MSWRAFLRLCAFHWEGMQVARAKRILARVNRKQDKRQREKRKADWERKVKQWPANDNRDERRALS